MRGKSFFFFIGTILLLLPTLSFSCELIDGKVETHLTGEGIAGAVVVSGAGLVRTDSEGEFSIFSDGSPLKVRSAGHLRSEVEPEDGVLVTLKPFDPKALYLSFYGIAEPVLRDPALELIEKTELNALVIDVKGDRGMVSYPSSVPLAAEIGAQRVITVRKPRELLTSLKEKGIYTIARIVTFKDDLLVKAHPELAVKNAAGKPWRDGEDLGWADPFSQKVWEYNIALAEEAASLGFDEIQFDYVRFPARAGLQFAKECTEENRTDAISGFLAAARKRLNAHNVYLSADIFGYVCWNKNDTQIGQQLERLAEHIDYLSPMLYPSGFTFGVGRYRNPVANAFETVFLSLNKARQRTGLQGLRFRPWLQAFRDYAFDKRHFGEKEIRSQTRASEEFGSNGWMLWNPRNVYSAAGLDRVEVEARADIVPVSVVQ